MSPPSGPAVSGAPRASNGGRLIFAAQLVRLVVRVLTAATLARLLTRDAYGLHGMAGTLYGALQMVRDFGIVAAVQQPGLTQQRFNALFRIALVGGIGLGFAGIALGPVAGAFFGEPARLPLVLAVMCSGFAFGSTAAPAIGLLYRQQRIGTVAAIEALAATVSSGAAIAGAWAGWEVWSLVVWNVTNEFVWCAAAWTMCSWRVGLDVGTASWRQLLAFGLNVSGYNVTTYCTQILDQVTVGRVAGAAALGLYGRGAQAASLPAQYGIAPYGSWIVSSLSQLRELAGEYAAFFRRVLNGLLHVSCACAAVCAALPALCVLILFGRAWLDAAPIVRWLAAALAVQPLLLAPMWLLTSTGKVRRLFAWSAAGAVLVGLACLATYPYGLEAVAAGVALATVAHAVLGFAFCSGQTIIAARDWLRPMIGPVLLHGMLAVLLWLLNDSVLHAWPVTPAALAAAMLAAAYYGAALLVPAVRTELRNHFFLRR